MTHIIRFPIGDWSDDGHGKCEYFEVRSNYSVQDVREVHFKALDMGINIGSICRDYEESELTDEMVNKLKSIDLNPNDYSDEEGDGGYIDPEGLILLWLDILRYVDSELELEIIKSEAKDINFYGHDEKNRHLETPGYGVFY